MGKIIGFFLEFSSMHESFKLFQVARKSIKLLLVDFLAMFDLMTLVFLAIFIQYMSFFMISAIHGPPQLQL